MTKSERITALEARIAVLEARLAKVEARPTWAYGGYWGPFWSVPCSSGTVSVGSSHPTFSAGTDVYGVQT